MLQEAEAMREELSAFDPAFFEELEDLKYEFEQVKMQNQQYVRPHHSPAACLLSVAVVDPCAVRL